MQSVMITMFVIIGVIKKDFSVAADIHKWNFDISINLSKYQYEGMCSTIMIQCIDSIRMINITSPTISHLHISNINDWNCLKRIDKCFLNARLSSPHMPPALIVSITNADNYVGWSCRMQKPFIARNNQIKIFAQNCFKERLKRSILSKPAGIYFNELIRNSPNYTISKVICFIVIPGITVYCITIYLIFCIILAQRARIQQQHQTITEETESYKQASGREIKQWITNVADSMNVSSLSEIQSSDLVSSKLIQQLPKKQRTLLKLVTVNQNEKFHSCDSENFSKSSRVVQNLVSASLISPGIAQENQGQASLKYSSRRSRIKWNFKNRNRTKRLPRKIAKHMETNISKKNESPKKSSSWISSRKESLKSHVNLPTATSIPRIHIETSSTIAKRSSNKLDQNKIEERQRTGGFETFSRQRVTTPHQRVKNRQPYLQKRILKQKTITNNNQEMLKSRPLDNQKMSTSRPLKTTLSPRPMIVQIVRDIPNDMEIPTRQMVHTLALHQFNLDQV